MKMHKSTGNLEVEMGKLKFCSFFFSKDFIFVKLRTNMKLWIVRYLDDKTHLANSSQKYFHTRHLVVF